LAGLAIAGAAWQLGGPAFAQGPEASGDQTTRKIENRIMVTVDGPAGSGAALHGMFGARPAHDLVAQIAEALGISKDDLLAEQKAGKTLDEIATAHGTTKRALLDKVQDAMRDEHKAMLEQAVTDGKLTREQADKMLEGFKVMIDLADLPNGDMPLGGAAGGTFFFKHGAPGIGADEKMFEFAVPAMPAMPLDGEGSWLPELGEPGELADVIKLHEALKLDDATVKAVRDVLTDAKASGKLTQEQVDKVLQRLEPQRMPMIRMFRNHAAPSLDDEAAAPANPRAASPL
jgi:hypothetical protein